MKKLLPGFVLLCLGLFSGLQTLAQNYQPFRKGLTYHYIARDSIYSMRIDSAKVVNGDSVFVFNPIARKGGPAVLSCAPPPITTIEYAVHPNNQFGTKMLKKANGDYIFKTHQGAEFLLKAKAAIGQNWTAFANPTITATLTSRTFEPVKNTVSDSVLTYTLSNGKTIKLSKNYGFLKAPNFSQYSDTYFKPRDLDFYALPEKGLGHTISSPFAIYDFQPGDKFGLYFKHLTLQNAVCQETWTRREIKSRTSSSNGDTIYYTIEEQKLMKGHGNPNAPAPFCQTPSMAYMYPTRTFILPITKNSNPTTNALTFGFIAGQPNVLNGSQVIEAIVKKQQYNNREQIQLNNFRFDTCSKTFSPFIDTNTKNTYAVGLGETKREYFSMGATQTTILECYTKGTETYGTCRSLADILATEEELHKKPLVQAFPNPFTSELSLTFGETSGSMQLSLRNTLGQIVWQHETSTSANAEMKLQLPELPKGIYVLKASHKGKIYTSRLVKQ